MEKAFPYATPANVPVYAHRQAPGLQPYLGARARTSLAWLSQVVLVLILVLLQLFLTRSSVSDGIGDAKVSFASTCSGAEKASSVVVSMPHFAAVQMNDLAVGGIESTIHGLGTMLDLAVQGMEALLIFIVDAYRSLYLCLAEFVVRGSLSLLISAAQEAEEAVTAGFRVCELPSESIGAAERIINGTIETIDKIPGVNIEPPSLGIPNLDVLANVTLPVDLSDALSKLNSSLPTLADLKDELDQLIAGPFELIRSEINSTLKQKTINRTLLAAPPQQTLAFCQDLDTSFIDDVGNLILGALRTLIIVIFVVMVVVIAFNAWRERWLYSRMVGQVEGARVEYLGPQPANSVPTWTLLAFMNQVQHPFASSVATKISGNRPLPIRNRTKWLISYLTHPSALLFLQLGLIGIFVVEVQLAALSIIRNRAVAQANGGVGQFTNLIASQVNDQTANASALFANSTNSVILGFQNEVNEDLFGWANTTTVTLNTTLDRFYTGLTGVVNSTFGSTPLAQPALTLVDCLIGQKVAGIEKALTFIHDNAHISLPTVNNSLLTLNANQIQSLAVTSGGDTAAESFVDKLIQRYRKSLIQQRTTFLVYVAAYGLVLLMGLVTFAWDTRRGTAEGSQMYVANPPMPMAAKISPAGTLASRIRGLIPKKPRFPGRGDLGVSNSSRVRPASGTVVPYPGPSPMDFADRGAISQQTHVDQQPKKEYSIYDQDWPLPPRGQAVQAANANPFADPVDRNVSRAR